MTNWSEAGRKAWATRQANDARYVRDLYRKSFGGLTKDIARQRAIQAFRTTGCTVVLDLWGGGLSALDLVAAGFRVIAVDDGSLILTDRTGRKVSAVRKRRALIAAAAEGGYEWRWGKASRFASEADGALLDFCGPWSGEVRRTIEMSRHMRAVIVTLMSDHDLTTGASTQQERLTLYQVLIRLAFGIWNPGNWQGVVRLLCRYSRPNGHPVFVFVVTPKQVRLGGLTEAEQRRLRPDYREARNAIKRVRAQRNRATWTPERRERERIYYREWVARNKAKRQAEAG